MIELGIKSESFTLELLVALKKWRNEDIENRSIDIETKGEWWRIWIYDCELMSGMTLKTKNIKGELNFTTLLKLKKIEFAKFQLEEAQKVLKEGI